MIVLQTETVKLSNGREITVSENDWDMSRSLNRLTKEAEQSVNGGTSGMDYFRRHFYPMLSAVSSGDVPTVEEAYALPRAELDAWYMAVWRMNPDWFSETPPDNFSVESVTLRDGSILEIVEAKGRPSFVIRLAELEEYALLYPYDEADAQIFMSVFYPKMAASIVGEPPAEDDMRHWPSSEINKVYEAAKRANPEWFFALDAVSEQAQAAAEKKSESLKQDG